LRIAQTLDTMTQELAKQKVLTISRPSLNPQANATLSPIYRSTNPHRVKNDKTAQFRDEL
jgi:hypothetical protein